MHKQFLLAALEQAWMGRGICAPNPSVGAVAVHNGKIIAQACHQGAGTLHAEQLLLPKLPENLAGVTLYVTLEPCNHWGRTPPCTDAIINYGIDQVVYAYRDPNPIVIANNTPDLLKKNGVEVSYYPLAEIDAFYQSYQNWVLSRKPFVTAKIAQTFDGKIAGPQGKRVELSNALCSEFTHAQRLHSDIILTTAQTVNSDDPLLNVRLPTGNASKPVAIIQGREPINIQANVLSSATHCHIYYDEYFPVTSEHPNCSYHAIPAQGGQLDLAAVINHLGSLGYHDVWVEAGGRLFTALHLARLVQKTFIYLVPQGLGETALSGYHHADIFNRPHAISWLEMGNNMIASLTWQDDRETVCSRA